MEVIGGRSEMVVSTEMVDYVSSGWPGGRGVYGGVGGVWS